LTLQDRLLTDLKSAMRDGDVARREAIRMLRAAILNEEIERQRPLTEDEGIRVVERLVKRHRESIEQFEQGGRADLVTFEQAQLEAVRGYLPQQLSPEEITERVRGAIAATGATGPGDSGRVMQRLASELRGKADLKAVSQVVREQLGG
jgi:uncharacterized protein YqeY